ncbi:uncharacterized protein LOC111674613 isoform X2 [Lucilia cuprina]|uniref:uncharacterized protein LOC111674613 isoform X2 n=1 Tax=Lucilia cuprina TaxID=7375 RepID=UPI001F06E8CF|nr:uncharacterized protein LOC111674613 isoform X2 [Lucilia cuprina]
MPQFWIIILWLGLLAFKPIDAHTDADVQLKVPRWVERGTSATLECLHDVDSSVLFKVSWFREEMKFFEFVKGRKPPFKNFTMEGAIIDWENSNESQVTLANVDFKLSGQFTCEVSMTSPLYTKASVEQFMNVFLPQTGPPVIRFRKRSPVAIGERLMALCNTTRARPAPHITWLINGKKVDEKHIRTHHVYSISGKNHRKPPQPHEQEEYNLLQAKQKKLQKQTIQQQYHESQQQPHTYTQQQYSIYQPQYHIPMIPDRWDKSLRTGRGWDYSVTQHKGGHHGHHGDGHRHAALPYNNPFGHLAIIHDIEFDDYELQHNYDNNKQHMDNTVKKHMDNMKKHRNSSSRKYRRHINENALGIIRSTLNSGGFGPQPPNMNNELGIPPNAGPMNAFAASYGRPLSHPGGGSGVAAAAAAVTEAQQEKGMFSVSQLNIELTEQHVGPNGRMELTCLSTIPSAVGPGEQFADYKTYSIKVDVGRTETTTISTTTPTIGMAALGNGVTPSSATSLAPSYNRITKIHNLWLHIFAIIFVFWRILKQQH